MRALCLLLSAVVVSAGCSRSGTEPRARLANRPAQAPPPRPTALTGVVLDFYTRTPFAGALLELKSYGGCKVDLETTTDAEGRFRFESPGLSKCKRDESLFLSGKDCPDCMGHEPLTLDGKKLEVRGGRGDLGRILVAHDAWATANFTSVCKGAAPPKDAGAATPLVVLGWSEVKNKWQGDFYVYGRFMAYDKFMTEPLLPWPAVLCSRSTYTVVGTYGHGLAKGHAVSTRAVLVRLRDGRRFSGSFHGEPPQKADANGGDRYGDTDDQLFTWLKKVAASSPS